MKDQLQMMNPPPAMMHQGHVMGQPSQVVVNPSQLLGGSQVMSQPQMINQLQLLGQSQALNPHLQLIVQPQMPTQPPVQMLNRSYQPWPQQQQQQPPPDASIKFHGSANPNFGAFMPGRSKWRGQNPNDKRQGLRNVKNSITKVAPSSSVVMGGYMLPNVYDLQSQTQGHLQARKFFSKKKFNNRFAPYAPRNTTSYIIRAKKSGGITSLVSPCPVTPSVLPTPVFSPSREDLGDMAKEEWGVDGYGSMKGLIRLRDDFDNREHEDDGYEDDNEEYNNVSGESDVDEEDNCVLSRLDHETNRFEMIYPSYGFHFKNMLESRVHDQDAHILELEEENLALRESLFLMEREMEDLRLRLHILEKQNHVSEDVNEEVVENGSDNKNGGCSEAREMCGEFKDDEGAEKGAKDDPVEEKATGVSYGMEGMMNHQENDNDDRSPDELDMKADELDV
ncbi:hypothetical protein SAY87_016740 [Trapa incisa]|uniref:PRLI-interacting factor A n=1 Tax=Trapa incisa TaxID=236973 RepID=A0AAN7QUL4_9MYRT|nr:hypothetical protein SAY87_016740 [Trapa incisa]